MLGHPALFVRPRAESFDLVDSRLNADLLPIGRNYRRSRWKSALLEKEVRLMQATELLVRHVIAERHLEADQNRLARLVRPRRDDRRVRVQPDRHDDWASERYVPILRGYPIDLFYANRSR